MASSSVPLSNDTKNKDVDDGGLGPLQKHAAFFDRNKDGLITLGKPSKGKFSLLFPIEVKNIHKGKHGSDSGVYDTEGRFVPAKFEEIFHKHAHTNPNALTEEELSEMLKGNRVPKDFSGWLGSWAEWKALYLFCKDKDGLLCKDTIQGVFDGSLFEKLEESAAARKKA
ncbi:hypothetical protein NE237_005862 [Protea cynaroides]|uniref:Peroxygenase 4 n=1 Tax=Protea cynaroides TaxID=273540 RepID=A0A9Q0QUS4_9MAGN|nr:hypothetical protein NE237_005862 [Protea cynaroides]